MKVQRTNPTRSAVAACILVWMIFAPSTFAQTVVVRVDGEDGVPSPSAQGSDWQASAYLYLQDAVDRANFLLVQQIANSVQLWVRGSTANGGLKYYPDERATTPGGSGVQSLSFHLRNNLGIYGGFALGDDELGDRLPGTNITILSGDLDDDDGAPGTFTNMDDNSYHVVRATNVTPTAILDGFTIQGGNAINHPFDEIEFPSPLTCDPDGHLAHSKGGGGLDCVTNASPRIENCIFRDNLAIEGGAIRNVCNCHPVIVGCVFILNCADGANGGGIHNWLASAPYVVNCRFVGNRAGHAGGAIGVKEGGATPLGLHLRVINCVFI